MWNPFREVQQRIAAKRYRDEHSRWLTRAMASGQRFPRIPTAEVSRGGFSPMMSNPNGRLAAEWWWLTTLEQVPR